MSDHPYRSPGLADPKLFNIAIEDVVRGVCEAARAWISANAPSWVRSDLEVVALAFCSDEMTLVAKLPGWEREIRLAGMALAADTERDYLYGKMRELIAIIEADYFPRAVACCRQKRLGEWHKELGEWWIEPESALAAKRNRLMGEIMLLLEALG